MSLRSQRYSQWECVIVDDGSTDGTIEVVQAFVDSDSRFRLLSRSRTPKGACTCRNIGVEAARGKYVVFLDSDDVIAPHCLEQRVSAAAGAGDVDFVVFPAIMFRREPGDEDFLWNALTVEDDLVRFLRLDSPWQGTGPLWNRDSFVRIGSWNERLACWQDIELSLRAFKNGMRYQTRYDLPPDLYLRRGDGSSISSSSLRSPDKLASKRQVLECAISLIEGTENVEHRHATKTLIALVIFDHVFGGASRAALALTWRSVRRGTHTPGEGIFILLCIGSQLRGIHKLPGSGLMRQLISAVFGAPSTIGRIRYFPSGPTQG